MIVSSWSTKASWTRTRRRGESPASAVASEDVVQEAAAVDALAEQASWRAGHLRETALRLQQDPDVTPRTLALLHQAADLVAARRRHRRHPL